MRNTLRAGRRGVDRFTIVLSPRAVRDLDALSHSVVTKIAGSLKVLENNPFPRGKLIKKIKGKGKRTNYYRIRADKYRVFYMIEATEVVILRVLGKKDTEKFIRNLD